MKEFNFLKENLNSLNDSIVFCHNDLLLSNIIHNLKKNSVTFIDYEYADCNYQSFDIANHFNEFAGLSKKLLLLLLFWDHLGDFLLFRQVL